MSKASTDNITLRPNREEITFGMARTVIAAFSTNRQKTKTRKVFAENWYGEEFSLDTAQAL